jgi:3-isopropylmalate/(R)-2-methylmalate dehydratase small subunit
VESFVRLTAIAAPLLQANVDTDQIIPTRFLTRLSEDGLGEGLFAEWRVRADGSRNDDFILNRAPWNRAEILLAGANFGCGSSREAAPRALRQRGFRAVIAPSFGDIFFNNCFRSGIVPVRLEREAIQQLAAELDRRGPSRSELSVDLEAGTVRLPDSDVVHAFTTPPRLRRMLLEGLDEIALTLTQADLIASFRDRDRARRPWAYL